tara:strand:+ start:147 stop:314 length:168 start_codon:yes stop_codon:yes gene_type:complete
MNEINWREEIESSKLFNEKADNQLKKGSKSFSSSWYLGALYTHWKKLKQTEFKNE